MSIYLGPDFPPTWNGYPTRMSEEDYRLWQRWYPAIRGQVLRMWFDVGLGKAKPIPEGTSAELAYMWQRNTQKRADVIIETILEIWLVELRYKAQPNAIGRLLLYLDLLEAENPWGKPIKPILVTDQEDPEVRSSAEKRGIQYLIT